MVLYGAAEPKGAFQHDPSSMLANPGLLFAAFVLMVGLFQPLLAALVVLLLTTRQSGGWAASARFLSRPAFQSLAGLSYDIYLLHPLVSFSLLSCASDASLPCSLCMRASGMLRRG